MELKLTISRSFSRKRNLGNYETADFFAAYSDEVDSETTKGKLKEVSEFLYDMAKSDVEEAMANYQKKPATDEDSQRELDRTDKNLQKKFDKLKEAVKTGNDYAGSLEDYQEVVEKIPQAAHIINELKKEYKRSDVYKSTLEYQKPGEKVALAKQNGLENNSKGK